MTQYYLLRVAEVEQAIAQKRETIINLDREIWEKTQQSERLQKTLDMTSRMVDFGRYLLSDVDSQGFNNSDPSPHLESMAEELVKIQQAFTAIWMNQPSSHEQQIRWCRDREIDVEEFSSFNADFDSDENDSLDKTYAELADLGLSEGRFADEENENDGDDSNALLLVEGE